MILKPQGYKTVVGVVLFLSIIYTGHEWRGSSVVHILRQQTEQSKYFLGGDYHMNAHKDTGDKEQ